MMRNYALFLLALMAALISLALPAVSDTPQPAAGASDSGAPNTDTAAGDDATSAGDANKSDTKDPKNNPQYVVIPLSDGGASWWHGRMSGEPKTWEEAATKWFSQGGDGFGPSHGEGLPIEVSYGNEVIVKSVANIQRPLLLLGTPVSINNNSDILFESGDIYHWDGKQVVFALHTHGPELPPMPPTAVVQSIPTPASRELPATTGAQQAQQAPNQGPVDPNWPTLSRLPGQTDGTFFWGHTFGLDDSGNVTGWTDIGLYSRINGEMKVVVPSGWRLDPYSSSPGPLGSGMVTDGWIAENGHGQIIAQVPIPAITTGYVSGDTDQTTTTQTDHGPVSTTSDGYYAGPAPVFTYQLSPPLFIQNGQVVPLEKALAAFAAASPADPGDQSGADSEEGGAVAPADGPLGLNNAEGASDADKSPGDKVAENAGAKKPKEFPSTPWPAQLSYDNWTLYPWDINDSGHIAGAISPQGKHLKNRYAALLKGNKMVLLMPLDSTDISMANGVNDKDQVVGYWEHPFTEHMVSSWDNHKYDQVFKEPHAMLWKDGKAYDLNDLIPHDSGWLLASANHINNKGEIVGVGSYGGHSYPFLLVPTSEFSKDNQPANVVPTASGDSSAPAGDQGAADQAATPASP